jgi:putative transposase
MFKTSDENLPEVREMFKEIMKQPEKMFEMLRIDLKSTCEAAIAELIKAELTDYLGRERYSRAKNNKRKKNYRNGSYLRKYTVKNLGTLDLKIARDRNGTFQSKMIDKYDRYEKVLEKDICLMFLSGLSTRGISMISKTLIGRKISHSEVSNVNKELLRGIEAWRTRSLHDIPIKYMYIDGVNFDMRVDRKVEKLPMLIVVGVTTENQKIFLAIQQGDKESASTWREVFKDLKLRGLAAHKVQLGIMDGLPGLEKVFGEEFMNAKIQRCQVHVARNVLCKVPKSLKKDVADRLRDVFYASSREKAKINFHLFIEKYEETIPSAVKSLKNNIDNCLTFYSFPEEEWISLRTSNTIERVNKEFKRRTKPMEILAGEESAYRLLSFVALKMELNWRSAPVGRNNLPSLDKFTHKS